MTGILCALPIIGAPTAAPAVGALSVTLNRTTVTGSASTSSVTSNTATATGANGTSPYTYEWSRVSGDSSITATNDSSRSTSFTRTGCIADTSYSATWRCKVTDHIGNVVYSDDVTITLTRTTSSGGGGTGGSGGTSGGGTFLGISDTTVSKVNLSPTATYAINSDGTITPSGSWNSSSTAGSGYEAKATLTSGSITSGTTGSWLALSSNRSWSIVGDGDAQLTVQIRATGTTTALDSAAITLHAQTVEA